MSSSPFGELKRRDKPPYRIPLMTEIAETPSNGLDVFSTFTGCGGSCLGFKMAGFNAKLALEFVPAAQDVYALNFPGVPIIVDDVRTVEPAVVMEYIGKDVGELDVLEGSPPCASFSTAGKRSKHWGEVKKYSDREQRTDDLFFEYVRLLGGLKPRAFVAENVTGLTKGIAKGYFREIHRALAAQGYRVAARTLDAQWLGVPQARQRVIFVGVREDLRKDPPEIPLLPYRYTVRDAIPLAVRHGTAPPHKDWQAAGKDVGEVMVDSGANAAPTIVASGENKGAGWVEVRRDVVHIWRDHARGERYVSDRPLPPQLRATGGWSEFLVEVEKIPADALPAPDEVRVAERVIHDRGPSWGAKGDVTDEPCPTITVGVDGLNSEHYKVEERVVVVSADSLEAAPDDIHEGSLDGTVIGPEWDRTEPGGKSSVYFNLVKAHPDAPSPTITAAGGSRGTAGVVHPIERRKFTIPELKRICGFPDDFQLNGTYRQKWERLGRAVPPPMMRAVAEQIRDRVLS